MNRFFATRRAIQKGDPLFDYKDSELRTGGYLTPVAFNVMESVIAALPGLAIMLILILGVQPQILKGSGIEIDMVELYRQLAFVCCLLGIYVFLPPIYTGIVAPFAGAGSIRLEDRTSDLKKRATRAYLFYDGAYGLTTQSCIGFAYVLTTWVGMNSFPAYIPLILALALFASLIHQLYLSFSKIPKLMFTNNGYTVRVRRFWQKKEPDDPPWNRYQVYYIGGGILTGICISFLLVGLESIFATLLG